MFEFLAAASKFAVPVLGSFIGGLFHQEPSDQAKAVAANGRIPMTMPTLQQVKPDDTYYIVGAIWLIAVILIVAFTAKK